MWRGSSTSYITAPCLFYVMTSFIGIMPSLFVCVGCLKISGKEVGHFPEKHGSCVAHREAVFKSRVGHHIEKSAFRVQF